ncbi:hypothetical protein [Microcoleus sp. FACHB-68]|uniref:hypothetical protein n=1 Tax=Microcoleus sp. FACHB-68 TaxID=2692826 RepID=UPI0016828B34|nr:hypothetical protein [Microcoleus sp. FACHB-68]MBD1939451.1 hypothetical protein [Microcoleus sp. FACHB-68]
MGNLRNRLELRRYIAEHEYKNKLMLTFALSKFAELARYPNNYLADTRWTDALILTDDGELIANRLRVEKDSLPEADIRMALLGHFYYQNLLVDFQNSNLDLIREILHSEIINCKLRIPYCFDRILYNRFAEMFPKGEKPILTPDEVHQFLEKTPQGVFQVGNLLSGPFGLIDSHAQRYLPPGLGFLWHSKEDGQVIAHRVALDVPDIPLVQAYSQISSIAKDEIGYASPWGRAFATEISLVDGSDSFNWTALPMLLADCIPGKERTQLLAFALNSNQKVFIRETLKKYSLKTELNRGNSEEVASKMQPWEQLQILLSISDTDLVSLIDEACNCGVLNIPLSEVRRPKMFPLRVTISKTQTLELKSRGIRLSGDSPSVKLTRLLVESYTESGELSDLSWKIRCNSLDGHQSKLSEFIYKNGPYVTLEKLVLSRETIARYFSRALKIPAKADQDDSYFISQCLFKLDFDEPAFDDSTPTLKSRLEEFRAVLLSIPDVAIEERRAVVRKAGVNLFVSLESFLQKLITYNTWLIFSDHYLVTCSTYNEQKALCIVPEIFGDELKVSEDFTVAWNINGSNTFGVLLRYLQELNTTVSALESRLRDTCQRTSIDIPKSNKGVLRPFPFKHTQLWADSTRESLNEYAVVLSSITRQINQAGIPEVRNGLDHQRNPDEFPSLEKMFAFETRVSSAVEVADKARLLPSWFWLEQRSSNNQGYIAYTFRDYSGKELLLQGPSHALGLRQKIVFGEPCIIAPFNFLGLPNSELVFAISDETEYSIHWNNYPIIRDLHDFSKEIIDFDVDVCDEVPSAETNALINELEPSRQSTEQYNNSFGAD